jgi:hypothetical protein
MGPFNRHVGLEDLTVLKVRIPQNYPFFYDFYEILWISMDFYDFLWISNSPNVKFGVWGGYFFPVFSRGVRGNSAYRAWL